ncbi:Uncharacterised protein [Serratia entomophila]|uniref:DUF2326 domain-containing protein n=1 Tax=Serratia entomophila TaxID=42906 RepID=UPI00217B6430|nr:DUF2326 domain-containing protein [Serratia entomophila]CAI0972375.1 Uncharacterised protein [Serratia entomophila]CAI1807311.1 Uncharacterised protein [Serratia entomophila]
MLTSIFCKKLSRTTLYFKSGLNTILGPRNGANSVGKSSVLYLIDFVFGGDGFLDNCKDVISQKGHLTVNATFEFDGVCYRFSRNTEYPTVVLFCVESAEKTIDDYKNFLLHSYGMTDDGPSFRSLVSRFSRIWRKGNEDPDQPLHMHPSEKYSDIKSFLIKTFGYSDLFRGMQENKKNQEALKSSLDSAIKQGIVESAGKRDVKKLEKELIEINSRIGFIKEDFGEYITSLESIVNERGFELIREKEGVFKQRSLVVNKISRLEKNLNNVDPVKEKYFDKLKLFIPDIDIERIKHVEAFHSGITTILREKIEEEVRLLNLQLKSIDDSLDHIDALIKDSTGVIDKPTELINDVLSLTMRENEIKRIISYSKLKEDVDAEVKGLRKDIDEQLVQVLIDVEKKINCAIETVCSHIYRSDKIYPELKLGKGSYVFEHYNDSGTGKSYSDLLAFDIAFLGTTELPILIEDSMIFKNIESKTNELIIEVLNNNDKQTFIAMDQLSLLNGHARAILREARFMRVSRKIPAFGELWNLKS